ncbi:Hypothetical predicted protein [Paramuricea clavata]|uniref:Uncharacterized protein n=1 Tax=Paramuricea clavata TaxID=317549 RepID=A0A7D9DJY4_PARCT|nr:Hypothetical predicted protein [Paramuricea clavata]
MRAQFCTSGHVVIQVLVVLSSIDTAKAEDFVACDNFINNMTCTGEKAMICIKSIDQIGTSGRYMCPEVPDATPNSNCSVELVKKYIFEKCNGETKDCILFEKNTDISPYCERAFKFVVMSYDCVSSPSECSTLESPKEETTTTTEPLPLLSNDMMAQKIKLPTTISPTKATKTPTMNENKNSTSRLGEIPATTALEPGDEILRNFSSSVPMPTSHAPNSRKKFKTCARKTTSTTIATVSSTTGVSSTKPSIVERNAGHSVLNTCFPLKFYVMVVSSLIVFQYYSWVSLSTSGW